MLCLLRFTTAGLLALVVSASVASAEEPLNLLFFGNSFSMDNVVERVGLLAAADGRPAPLIVRDLEGGKALDHHLGQVDAAPQNNVDHPSIAGKTWDFVVMQEFSTRPTHIGDPVGFRADALALYRRVRDHPSGRGAGVTAVLFQTWARAPGNAFYPSAFTSPTAMQAELRTNYLAAADDIRAAEGAGAARVAPVGDGFEALGFDSSLYDGDLYHQSNHGALLASLVLYRTVYSENVGDIDYGAVSDWAGVDEATWRKLTATADALKIADRTHHEAAQRGARK